VRAVLAQSYERIHRSNLVGMGVLPLEFLPGESAAGLRLDGRERYDLEGLAEAVARGSAVGGRLRMLARGEDGRRTAFEVRVRIDTPSELDYYRHGGILPFVLREMLGS
jgi:aconitate hydratase